MSRAVDGREHELLLDLESQLMEAETAWLNAHQKLDADAFAEDPQQECAMRRWCERQSLRCQYLQATISETVPTTLDGVAVKLRILAHSVVVGDDGMECANLRTALLGLERLLGTCQMPAGPRAYIGNELEERSGDAAATKSQPAN